MTDELDPKKALELEQGVNQGVLLPESDEPHPGAALDMSQFPIVAPDSNMDPFLSDFDNQFTKTFDTLGCNIFSSIGMSEMYLNAIGGDPDYSTPQSPKVELSEREACVEAGLNGTGGSSEQMWEDAVNNLGLTRWDALPWTSDITQSDFFAALTPEVKAKALLFLKKYKPFHRPVGLDKASIIEALKYGAVKIFIGTGAGFKNGEPTVIPKTDNPMGHAVLIRKVSDLGFHIRDHYPPYLKVLAPDYIIYFAYQTLYKKIPPFKHTFNKDLQFGMIDPENIQLQTALTIDGEFPSDVPYSQRFGNVTLASVEAFQLKYNIVPAGQPGWGRCGPLTRAKLNKLFS